MSTSRIDMAWTASTDNVGVTGYKIYRNGSYLTTVTPTTHSDLGLANNTNYCYRVSAVDSAGNESGQSNQACAATHVSWTKQWGSTADDKGRGIVTDGSGNIYVTGATMGSIDGQANAGDTDAFLTKYNSSGTREWTKYIGTSGTDWGQAVDVDGSGNVYVTGYVSGSFDGKTHHGGKDVFLAKYNSSGNRLWYQQWGTSTNNSGYSVRVYGSYVYVTGPTEENISGDTGSLIPNIFIAKRNTSDGSEVWTILDGTPNYSDYAQAIDVDSSGNVYIAGYTTGTFVGPLNDATYDIFVAKYDPNTHARLWVSQRGAAGTHHYAQGVAVDGSNVYVTGYSGSGSSIDIVLMKFDSSGNWTWTKLFGTSDADIAYGIAIDTGNNIYLTGSTRGALGGTNQGQEDVFLMKCDSDGNQLWTQLVGTTADDTSYGVSYNTNDEYIYLTGYTTGNLDGNITMGSSDVFMLKYNSSGARQ